MCKDIEGGTGVEVQRDSDEGDKATQITWKQNEAVLRVLETTRSGKREQGQEEEVLKMQNNM